MKNLLTGLLALFVFAPAVRAEVIDAVLFNPSRLGRYENLKVSSELDASGGVNVQTATVQSHSAVNVNSPSGYNLENVSAHKVNLPNTAFQSSSFQVAGGKASFGSGEIQQLRDSAQKMIRVKGKTVTVSGDVAVEMVGGEDSSNQEVKGLRLGGNDIPQPASGCVELDWYAQKAASGKEYKVLGFRSCPGGEGECTKTCGAGYTLNEETCECEAHCPEGKIYDEEYKQCVCEEEFYLTQEYDDCWGEVTCADGTNMPQRWNNDICRCENDCRPTTEEEYHLVCQRMSFVDAAGALAGGGWSKDKARKECELYGNIDAVGYTAQEASSKPCPPAQGPITTPCNPQITPAWGAMWHCVKGPVNCGGGIGSLDICSCYYGVG